jgi:hypothetical protein
LNELNDARDHEDHGDDPQNETHVGVLPVAACRHTSVSVRVNRSVSRPCAYDRCRSG